MELITIKDKDLRDLRPQVRYKDGESITLEVVQEALRNACANYGIPVAFNPGEVKSGGLFSGTTEECFVVFHPEHSSDYCKIAVRVRHQGTYAFVAVNDFGVSKQMKKAAYAEGYKQDRQGKSMSYKVGSMIGQSIATLGKNQQKLEEEQNWYQMICDIFDEIIC